MESEVRRLFLEYGVKNVMNCVNTVSKALYEELKEIYETPAAAVSETVSEVISETVAEISEAPVEKKGRRLRIVKKKETAEPVVEAPVEAPAEADEKSGDKVVEVVTLRVKKKVAAPVEVQQTAEESDSDSDATVPVDGETPQYKIKSPEEIKKERLDHRAAVEKKRAELVAQGIVPESLVTKENLEKWLGAGMSYQRIAKEVGCHEQQVSYVARGFGLKSQIAAIMIRKHRGY
jgi:hypothetical protein